MVEKRQCPMSVFSRPIVQTVRSVSRIPFYGVPKIQTLGDVLDKVNFTARLDAPYGEDCDYRTVVRDDIRTPQDKPLPLSGRLTPQYHIVQHSKFAEKFLSPFLGEEGEIVGSRVMGHGAKFTATIRLKQELILSERDKNDIGQVILTIRNGMDGTELISGNIQLLRSMCSNGMTRFISKKVTKRKHYGKNFNAGLDSDFFAISDILEQGEEIASLYRQLSVVEIPDDHRPRVDAILTDILGNIQDKGTAGSRAEGRWAQYHAVLNSDRAENETFYGVFQAISEVIDHNLERRISEDSGGVDSNRFLSLVGGTDEKLKQGIVKEFAELAGLEV